MEFLHSREYLRSGQSVRVDCDTQCNVMLLDDHNFDRYRSGRDFNYYNGFYERFPAVITPPHAGYWNIVLDLGGASATIRHSIQIIG